MTAAALFSGPFFSALGWALFHFLWQGALVAALLGALGWLLRNRTPALRYALACGALATMLGLPVATAWSLAAGGGRTSDVRSGEAPTNGGASVSSIPLSDVRQIRELGFRDASVDDLVSMRIHGVSADFARRAKARNPGVTVDELVSMRIYGRD